ncbi:CLUMA_CG015582, isoform A [Clunio marinus]|uniref:CLUMA_CG015582, isoform A n=1 Tax=Clunio marinus TaxID=568069 RepID=A0A1J1IRM1_9DIPT|nr:CLUMA_CG015582, isoform A [Clunio marinus]
MDLRKILFIFKILSICQMVVFALPKEVQKEVIIIEESVKIEEVPAEDIKGPSNPCAKKYEEPCLNRGGSSTCVCMSGFIRDRSGNCVRFGGECPRNEILSCANRNHELTCDNLDQKLSKAALHCVCCDAKCMCAPGFVRHSNGQCVPKAFCSLTNIDCGEHESYSDCQGPEDGGYCYNSCEPDCKHVLPYFCRGQNKPGCYCDINYVRHDGKCISIKECFRKI